MKRRTLDDDTDVYSVFNRGGGKRAGDGIIFGTTPGAEHKVFDKLPEYDKILSHLQKSYYDRIPEWEKWRDAPAGTIPRPEPLSGTYFARADNGGFLVSTCVPPVPEYPWENPNYSPIAFTVQKMTPTIFGEFHVFADRVRQDVMKNIILCVLLGIFGLLLVLAILAVMSSLLTQPLKWITIVARKVINNDEKRASRRSINSDLSFSYSGTMEKMKKAKKKRKLISSTSRQYFNEGDSKAGSFSVDDPSSMNRDLEADNKSENGFVNFDYHPEASASPWCTLSTELLQLLEAFQSMIHGFSGDGVSEVAEPGFHEIQNSLTWHSDFSKLYEGDIEAEDSFKKLSPMRQVSSSTRATTIGSMEDSFGNLRSNNRDSSHKSRLPQDYPTFYSSAINDQNSSGELSPPQRQDMPESRSEHDCGIILPGPPPKASNTIVPAPMKLNLTSTLGAPEFDPKPMLQNREWPCQKIKTACCSRLFWWIVLLMVSHQRS